MDKKYVFQKLNIAQAVIINTFDMSDNRGSVHKIYEEEVFKKNGVIFKPTEELIIRSNKNVLRGMHFQKNIGQAKLVSLLSGNIYVVILDVDINSNSYRKWVGIELKDANTSIYIPANCALGTLAFEESLISCMCDYKYVSENATGVLWNDSDIAIGWPLERLDGLPILSEKDKQLRLLEEVMI